MDFYKKIIKSKDLSGVLNEKEYKCVSLQAIVSEAVKENNKESLKDLVEEINGHLTDLRLIKDDKELKNKDKCEKLIKEFEECLVKILNKKPSDNVLTVLNQKLEELQHLSNIAIRELKNEEIRKLVERIERNLEVVKEMPEVKNAKNADKGEDFLKLVSKYEDMLKIINGHLTAKKRIISEPMSAEVFQKTMQGNIQDEESHLPQIPNKIGLNEVEEKLKLMRQKRLNRLSTFVDQQSKLSEKRSRENSPKNLDHSNKSLENLSKISESLEIETAIKSIQSSEIIKPPPFRPIAPEKLARTTEQKVFSKTDEKVVKSPDQKLQARDFRGQQTENVETFKSSYLKGTTAYESEKKITSQNNGGRTFREEKVNVQNRRSIDNTVESTGPNSISSGVRSSFGKGTVTRSFAERQIENAKMQAFTEKPKLQHKSSNSSRTTPPRTPTQIRKIFNSFNACVLGSNNNKSIEDLPKEFNSPFEQELKTVQLKSTGFENRLEKFREAMDSPPAVPRRIKVPSKDKPEFARSIVFGQKENDDSRENLASAGNTVFNKKEAAPADISLISDQLDKTASGYYDDNINPTKEPTTPKILNDKRRFSLDFDSVIVRKHEPIYVQPTDLVITVKRDSNTIPHEGDRHSFTTFRDSIDSLKSSNSNSVENPLYGLITLDNVKSNEPPKDVEKIDPARFSTGEKVLKELINNCNSLEELLKTVTRQELRNINYVDKIKELNILLKEVRSKVEDSLDVDENTKETSKFTRFFQEVSKLENTINSFKYLKRDSEYMIIDKQLAKYYVEIDQIRAQSSKEKNDKINLTERLKNANKKLEEKVTKNEDILKTILEEQVRRLGEKYKIA